MDNDWGNQLYTIQPHREGCTQIECDCCYSHPAEECVGVDVNTAAGKKHLTLCRIHASKILQRLASEAGEHPALMAVLQKKEAKKERAAVARGERMTLSAGGEEKGIRKSVTRVGGVTWGCNIK